ncbi:acid protease [Microthyrium microscopicum]|uniref:Acid protease n=1 Tax=Microthyrium microscopicum TaxID=703497 RepID=A0A6A6U1S5_9PEZI|nr:acid protease [Microthyrium microscopicum]
MGLYKRAISIPSPFSVQTSETFDGNDGKWSTFFITAGSSQLQFRALISSASYYSRVISQNGCKQGGTFIDGCTDWRGEDGNTGYVAADSSTRDQTASGQYQLDINDKYLATDNTFGFPPDNRNSSYTKNNNATFDIDQINISSGSATAQNLAIPNTPLAATVQPSFFLSYIGLAIGSTPIGSELTPSLLETLYNASSIPSKSFAYTAGAYYKNYYGSLTLGGWDQNRMGKMTSSFGMPTNLHSIIPQVTVNNIVVQTSKGDSISVTTTNGNTNKFPAVIETTLPFLYLPESICDKFQQIFGLTYEDSSGLYRVNNTQRQINMGSTITIDVNDINNPSTSFEIILPYAAFDLNTSWPISNGSYFPIRRSPSASTTNILGRTILQETYMVVNYENQTFSLGQALFPSSNDLKLAPILADKYNISPSSGLSKGAIAGIVVGAILLLAAIAGLIFFFLRRKRRRASAEADKEKAAIEEQDDAERRASTMTGTTVGRPGADRHLSELSSDSEHPSGRHGHGLYELPEEGKPLELEDKTDTAAWRRNSELRSQTGGGRFFELMGDMPDTMASTGSTPRFTSATPAMTPPTGTPATTSAVLANNRSSFRSWRSRRRTNSGGVSPQSGSVVGGASPSAQFSVTPVSPSPRSPSPTQANLVSQQISPDQSPRPDEPRTS